MRLLFIVLALSSFACGKKKMPLHVAEQECLELSCEQDEKGPFNCVCK